MQKDFVFQLKSLFGQHGHTVRQMRCIDRLTRFTKNSLTIMLLPSFEPNNCSNLFLADMPITTLAEHR